jgi:hypothetical protein
MKLRLDEHSVRLRLSKSDIETLDNQGSVRTFTALPGGNFEYCIETGTNLEKTECILTGSALKVLLPATQAEKWTKSEDVETKRLAEALSRLRLGQVLDDDLDLLNTRILFSHKEALSKCPKMHCSCVRQRKW